MKKIISVALLFSLFVTLLMSTIALAWMSDRGMSSPVNITSNLRKSYFESGNGSKEQPYEIASPVQLYYFSWLQYLGYFNETDETGRNVPTFYFYVSKDLDMTGYTLPPIGTMDNPFVGNFDGRGHTISNLTVENTYGNLVDPPANTDSVSGVEIIGFFGVVGAIENSNYYSYETIENQVTNLILDNITVKTQTDTALIGLVAGYVNGLVNCVGVVNSTVDIKSGTTPVKKDANNNITNNLSDYALIGYCAENYKGKMYSLDLSLYDPTTNKYQVIPSQTSGGEGTGWGGSIKMSDIFTWLDKLNSSGNNRTGLTTSTTYTLERVDVVTLGDKHVTIDTSNPTTKQTYVREKFGAFVFTNTQPNHVNFVSGGQKVTQFKYAYTKDPVPLYHITDGNNYLCFDGNDITSTTVKGSATEWYIDQVSGGYNIYTVVGTTVYYLDISNNDIILLTDVDVETRSDLPVWTVEDGELTCNSQIIACDNGNWIVTEPTSSYSISYDNNYLSITNSGSITNEVGDSNTVWTVEFTSNNKARISTVLSNGRTRYLGATASSSSNGTLQLNNTETQWNYDATNKRFSLSLQYSWRSYTYYICCNGGEWGVSTSPDNATLVLKDETSKTNFTLSGNSGNTIVCEKTEFIDNSTQNYTYDQNGNKVVNSPAGITYFPLSTTVDVANKSFAIASGNTGYIIGAEWGVVENDEHDQYGNIRISSYGSGSILNKTKPYTISYKTQGKFKTIPDVYNDENISESEKTALANLGLQKYADCYPHYYGSVQNSCDGLHFMEAAVSMSNIATIPYAYLNGEEYYDYQVPTNCIDFNLYERGFINFVAGSYFTNNGVNNSFFSLYEIVRNKNNEITDIKEIYKIYAKVDNGVIDTTKPYVYTYQEQKEGTEKGKKENIIEVGDVPEGYEAIFDCMWMIYPDSSEYYGTGVSGDPTSWVAKASSGSTNPTGYAYYYEVPVNAGEYAIGSSAGRIGAYLVYLDLAANAQIVERTRVDEKSETKEYTTTVPNGVSLLPSSANGYDVADIKSENSAFVSIGSGSNNPINFSQSGNVVTDSGTGHTAVFVGSGIELRDGAGNIMTVPITNITKTITVETTTFYDTNLVTEVKTKTVIKKTTEQSGNTKTETYYVYHTATENGQETTTTYGPYATLPDLFKLCKFTVDPVGAPPQGEFNNVLLNAQYSVSDTSKFALDFTYTPTGQGGATSPSYAISATNETDSGVRLAIALTSFGVTKGITYKFNETPITTTAPLVVTVEKETAAN